MRLPACGLGLIVSMGAGFGSARAASADYRFARVTATVERGVAVILKVEMHEVWQNQLVPGAEITQARVDRSPDGRPEEFHPAFFEPSLEYGVYRFRANMPTDGNWALTFLAKVSGVAPPVAATVTFAVIDPAGLTNPIRPIPGGTPQR